MPAGIIPESRPPCLGIHRFHRLADF